MVRCPAAVDNVFNILRERIANKEMRFKREEFKNTLKKISAETYLILCAQTTDYSSSMDMTAPYFRRYFKNATPPFKMKHTCIDLLRLLKGPEECSYGQTMESMPNIWSYDFKTLGEWITWYGTLYKKWTAQITIMLNL